MHSAYRTKDLGEEHSEGSSDILSKKDQSSEAEVIQEGCLLEAALNFVFKS
jgi:hypothetical protein